jgi:hypothetical protein
MKKLVGAATLFLYFLSAAQIQTLPDLFKELEAEMQAGIPLESLEHVMREYAGKDWKELLEYSWRSCEAYPYKRVKVPTKSELFDCYLIIWPLETGMSRIHNHAQNGCLQKVLKGSLREKRYSKENGIYTLLNDRILPKGSVGYIDDAYGLHSLGNAFEQPAISLHIYSPPGFCTEYFGGEVDSSL